MTLRKAIDDNFELLHRSLNPSSKLFLKLGSVAAITHRLPSIKKLETLKEKNEALFEALLDVQDDLQEPLMNDFIAALRSSDQDHVANIFRQESEKVPMSDEHYKLLTHKRSSLCQIIKPKDGLIDCLFGSGVFSALDHTAILGKSQVDDAAREVLNILLRKSDCAFERFVKALNETRQSHAAYLLTGVGPPPMSDQHRKSLLAKIDDLCKFVDVENGLLDRLVGQEIVSLDEAERIRSFADESDMVRTLVSTLVRKHDGTFIDFINALRETGQDHVRYILTGEGDSRPLNNKLRDTLLSQQRDRVINMIDSKYSSFVSTLMSKGVFSKNDEQRVVSVRPDTAQARNEIILNLVAKKSQSAFFNFISALNDTQQTHAFLELIGVNVVAKLKAEFDFGGGNGDNFLPNVDKELLQYVQEMFQSNGIVVQRINKTLSEKDVAVTDVRKGCIQITFTCKTLESLKYLEQLYISGELKTLLNEAFCPEFADKGLLSLAVEMSYEQFDSCEKSFNDWALMTSQHREALESSEEWLVEKMTVSDDLLKKLTLCQRRRHAIESAATGKQQVKTLIDIVSRRPDSAFSELLYALNCTQQVKTAEMLLTKTQSYVEKVTSPGHKALKRTSDVSSSQMEQERKRQKMVENDATLKDLIKHNFPLLLRCMDPSNELLGGLMSVQIVNDHLSLINQQVTIDDKANALLTALLQTPDEFQKSAMDSFVSALRNSGQNHVANIFRQESDHVPMSSEHRKMLVKHRYQLCQFMDPENGLLNKLVSLGVISSVDDRRIRSKNMHEALVRELIDTILKKSDDAFQALIQALNQTEQSHVTFILTGERSTLPLNDPLTYILISRRLHIITTMEAKKSGLVSALVTKGVFSQYDAQRVRNKYREDNVIINETILDLLMRKSHSSFDSFIAALKDTRQEDLAATLEKDMKPSTTTSTKPLKGLLSLDNCHTIAIVESLDNKYI